VWFWSIAASLPVVVATRTLATDRDPTFATILALSLGLLTAGCLPLYSPRLTSNGELVRHSATS
jgi:hypothetical protein